MGPAPTSAKPASVSRPMPICMLGKSLTWNSLARTGPPSASRQGCSIRWGTAMAPILYRLVPDPTGIEKKRGPHAPFLGGEMGYPSARVGHRHPNSIFPTYNSQDFRNHAISSYSSKPQRPIMPVSYTHLRAHETVLDLVCRL